MLIEENNVLFVEPNYVSNQVNKVLTYDGLNGSYIDTNQYEITELSPDLSDFCIAIDLEVEVHDRVGAATLNQGSKVIIIKFNSGDSKDNYNISFLSGTKCKYGENSLNYLTTSPYDNTTIQDITESRTTEMFGINSIDIEYDNYMVPVVTIKFTDIRGVSLFGLEELRHNQTYNGIKGFSSTDIAGSFFKCFFTFPYPKFSLMVKGFYGHPVTYELTCSEFKASFDSSTGSFNATATFIGYSFALINDITLNTLIAAPLSDYIGAKYWESRKFKFENNTVMPRLIDVLSRYKYLQNSQEQLEKDNPLFHDQTNLEIEISKIQDLNTSYSNYFDNVDIMLNGNKGYERYIDSKNKVLVCVLFNDSFDLNNFNNLISHSKENFIDKWESVFDNDYSDLKNIKLFKYNEKDELTYNDNVKEFYYELKKTYNQTQNNAIGYYVFDGLATTTHLKDYHEKKLNKKTEIDKLVSQSVEANVDKFLGFKPTIKNVTHLLLAHLETLLHCIYTASEEVNNRTLSDLRLNETNINKNITNKVGLFPQVNAIVKDDYEKLEDVWIGDINGGEDSPEVKLIHGLLNGIDTYKKTVDEVSSSIKNDIKLNGLYIDIPVAISDIISNENFFESEIDYSDLSDFVGRLFFRISNVIGSHNGNNNTSLLKEMGKADAKNFYSFNKTPSNEFLNVIYKGALSEPDKIINFALSLGNNHRPNAWDKNNNEVTSFLSYSDSYLQINCIKKDNHKILPIVGGDWVRLLDLCSGDTNKDFGSILTNNTLLSTYDDVSIAEFEIDLDYQKYIKLQDIFDSKEFPELKKRFHVEYDKTKLASYFGNTKWYQQGSPSSIQNVFRHKYTKIPDGAKIINSLDDSADFYYEYVNSNDHIWYRYDDKIKSILRSKEKESHVYNRIENCFEDLNLISNYTISQFIGYDNNGLTANKTLFAQQEYYQLKNKYEKAYVFINLFDVDKKQEGDEFDNIFTQESNHFLIVPYILVLKYGAYYWKKRNEFDLIGNFNNEYLKKPIIGISNLRYDVKNRLIKEFKDWVDNYFVNRIHIPFVFKDGMLKYDDIKYKDTYKFNPKTPNKGKNIFSNYLDSNSYYSIKETNYSTVFINKDSSPNVDYVVQLLIKPCVLIKTIRNLKENKDYDAFDPFGLLNVVQEDRPSLMMLDKTFYFKREQAINYIQTFIGTLNDLYKDIRDVNTFKNTKNTICTIDKNIKISLYKYLKILWDRWLVGAEQWQNSWAYDSFKKRWHFIDSFHNVIGDNACLNMGHFIEELLRSQQQETCSLLTFISGIYSKNRFNLYNVQNFLSIVDSTKMKEMFTPLPYNMITNNMLKMGSDFVAVYTYEYSSQLDMGDSSTHKTDSFDICGDITQLPIQIKNKRHGIDNKIPAFGVTYGKQYQSYFKDISVSMDSPMATEQALLAKFQIAGMHSNNAGENGKKVMPIGPDLYTIYANNSYSCTVKMMGCAWIQPLMIFQLNNVPMFRGSYLVQKVSHHIEPGNMETTILGTRMAKNTNRLFNEPWLTKDNIENGGIEYTNHYQHENASIYNDCEYKFFNPLNGNENIGMTKSDLDLTINQYGEKYGGWKITIPSGDTRTMAKFLGDIAYGEARNQDELGIKLVLTVLYNRCIGRGNFTKVLYNNKQHEIGLSTSDSKYEAYAREIFEKTPIVLRGKMTNVAHAVPIWNKGVQSGSMTISKEITLSDLQSIDGYCTTLGYDSNNKTNRNNLEPYPPQWWHGSGSGNKKLDVVYCLQHDKSSSVKGHVFVSGESGKSIKYWDVPNITSETLTKSDLIESLFESINRTVQTSNKIHIKSLEKKLINGSTGEFEISVKNSQSDMAIIFDIILNTYMDYVKDLAWVVENSTSELPSKIRVKVTFENIEQKRVFVSKIGNEMYALPLTWSGNSGINEDCNELFYLAIKKRYGSDFSKHNFEKECINYSSIISKYSLDWKNKLKNVMNKVKVDSCKMGYDNGFDLDGRVEKYSWDSFTDNEANKVKPSKPKVSSNGFNVTNMVNHVVENLKPDGVKGGQCAKYVREAIEAGGITATTRPNSACVYKKHLETWGFRKVFEGVNKDGSNFTPRNGDISVSAASKEHEHGHIQIYATSKGKWCSDKAYYSICGYKEPGIPYEIYRYNNMA